MWGQVALLAFLLAFVRIGSADTYLGQGFSINANGNGITATFENSNFYVTLTVWRRLPVLAMWLAVLTLQLLR
jgi:hypothetical protein